jgi:hypothetical protein
MYDVLHGDKFKGMSGGKAKLMVNKKMGLLPGNS